MHWLHSLDQIVYRLGAACFTHTEFARVLYELREDRKHAMAMTFAESHRSAFRQEVARVSLEDDQETKANKLRSQATMMEDGARVLITRSAFVAAQIELEAIEFILETVQQDVENIPYAFIAVQRTENTLALFWKAFVEQQSYHGQINYDTRSEILSRGLTLPDFAELKTRDDFAVKFSKDLNYNVLRPRDFETLYLTALKHIEKSPLLNSYMDALTDANTNPAFLGHIPKSVEPLAPVANAQRLGDQVPHGRG